MNTSTQKQVQKCNDILRREFTVPRYSWQWSENLTIPMRLMDANGERLWDYQANPITGLIQPVALYKERKVAPGLKRQWVLCKFVPPCSEREHRAAFGDLLEWPRYGMWAPISPSALKPDVPPDEKNTWRVVAAIKEELANRDAEMQRMKTAEDDAEKAARGPMRDMIKDLLPAFGNDPGKKGSTSFGGSEIATEQ